MGPPLAETVIQHSGTIVLPHIKPKIWIRYVTDNFAIIKKGATRENI